MNDQLSARLSFSTFPAPSDGPSREKEESRFDTIECSVRLTPLPIPPYLEPARAPGWSLFTDIVTLHIDDGCPGQAATLHPERRSSLS